ncbi:gliding motility-associated C-terminal domain-containing protein [Pedobacter sp. JY14-1]|uniref:gliding motility-associated C-terminal domain-containing protein n=1 Tax=Pedobacter sp. JY14-1 TaxID=3034151 RepID=UPI0023E1E969|nr:gliding motility-associated C-terminal domain-containing protein [Pedobacter sp. JY14-1]
MTCRDLKPLILLFSLIFCASFAALAQVCTGSLGDPVVNIDFGRGSSQFGPPFSNSNYKFVTKSPEDGEYTIAQSTIGMNRGWYTIYNHTPGDFNGYMMIVNADYDPGVFYESSSAISLCPNTTYEFAAWVINMLRNEGGNKPNITFSILSVDGQVLQTYNTGDLRNNNPVWTQYGFLFTTTSGGEVKIRMVNNGPGGGGNDIAIDDITFRPCGPLITARAGTSNTATTDICEHSNSSVKLSTDIEGGSATLKYQWQRSAGADWIDIPGETGTEMEVKFTDAQLGVYQYRMVVAEPQNFNSPDCRTSSPTLTIRVNKPPVLEAMSNGPVCVGDNIILDINIIPNKIEWRDPAGKVIADTRTPVIYNATHGMQGTYTAYARIGGCDVSAAVDVKIVDPPVPKVTGDTQVCTGSQVQLEASGGDHYSWEPALGLSDPNIANPMASPPVTTVYTVKVYRGTCFRTAQVRVQVNKSPVADAGPDRKSLLGNYTTLSGKASGDGIYFSWSPETGVADPRSLNPKVTPPQSMTYTLSVYSSLGCEVARDEVFVQVYDKMVIPSAFSPNNDQVNDTWNITAIDAFEEPVVKVVNRYGETVFESKGYLKPWDGKRGGQDLPTGVYYYFIRLREEVEPLTGSVMIIR